MVGDIFGGNAHAPSLPILLLPKSTISCPIRCCEVTRGDVRLAGGTVVNDWGTKVAQLVEDVIETRTDVLLMRASIVIVLPSTGASAKMCPVMLLNVKKSQIVKKILHQVGT